MPKISWHPSFSVGVDELDQHHQHLAQLINQLDDYFPDGEDSEKLVDILTGLVCYAKYHFDQEERCMEQHGYPLLASHRVEHVQFCETVAETCRSATLGSIGVNDLCSYLTRWWRNHILDEDMKYKPFLLAAGGNQVD